MEGSTKGAPHALHERNGTQDTGTPPTMEGSTQGARHALHDGRQHPAGIFAPNTGEGRRGGLQCGGDGE